MLDIQPNIAVKRQWLFICAWN